MDDFLFELFDSDDDVHITERYLPHWNQDGKTYFIAMRSADSLPKDVLAAHLIERENWLRRRKVDMRLPLADQIRQLSHKERKHFFRRFRQQYHDKLDECHGECLLRDPALAKIVADSLLHFDGARYHTGDFVVMPNHLHMLVQFLMGTDLKKQCWSWKQWTTRHINVQVGRKGGYWQTEAFDHLVRSPEQFNYLRLYIEKNPEMVRLSPGEFFHYCRDV